MEQRQRNEQSRYFLSFSHPNIETTGFTEATQPSKTRMFKFERAKAVSAVLTTNCKFYHRELGQGSGECAEGCRRHR
eukprot:scaffold19121_cov66-Cyclotella_meneghiniana.AAC.5